MLNVSRDVPETLGVLLFGYGLPILLVLTIITNLLIVIVLSQVHMRTPTNIVLLAMAIADLLTLLVPAPWYIYLFTFGNYHQILYPPLKCYIFHCMYEVLPALFHTYSIWLTLLLAAQRYVKINSKLILKFKKSISFNRYVYVCHFSTARTWCTVPKVTRAIFIILILAILHQSTRFVDRVFLTIEFEWNNVMIEGCQYLTANWVINTKKFLFKKLIFLKILNYTLLFL